MANRTPQPPPKADPILIIGAGVFGLSTALELSLRGYKNVTVLDRYPPPVPDGSSVDISRIIRTEYADSVYSKMAQEALKGWKSEYKDYYHHTGFVMMSETASNPYIEKTLEIIHAQGRTLDELADGNGLKEMYPDLRVDMSSLRTYHNPEGGWADAQGSIRHLSHKCSQAGISFVTGPRGTVLSLRKRGSRVIGVDVVSGDFIPAAQVILSTGAWSNLLLDVSHAASASGQPVGFIQLSPEEARSIARTPVMINLTNGIFCFPPTPETHILKVARHSYGFATSISSSATNRTVSSPKLDSNNADKSFLPQEADEALREGLRQFMPQFADRPWSNRRLCWYTDTPEGDFVVDHHPVMDGLFVAIGGAGHGFKFLPVIGRYIVDRYEDCAPEAFRQKWRLRLPDGSGDLKIGDGSRAGPPLRMLTVEEQGKL
ncbi:FAD dependent oxidoreductase [Aspergillus coremiiformis]|uniref:FAD dependent oxidoreductase n=1 Tax=Aspergillus coremiiformis TaxID=138285 RepID=A0A5N6YYK4_9EURO|nr:FAD dependent oxidoreductase [Aspergillus coremiiformis]